MTGAAGRARELLRRAEGFARRLRAGKARPGDLHGLRVCLRRLLVHLKAHGGACGAGPERRRALRRVFRSTGPARDDQMLRAWLARRAPEAARALPVVPPHRDAVESFLRQAPRLRALFAGAAQKGRDARRFERKSRKAAKRRARKLRGRLERLGRRPSAKALHGARIAAKKLRYLLEPLKDRRGLPPESRVKRLQTLLGDIHDRDVIEARLRAAAPPAAARAQRERKRLLSQALRLAAGW